MGSKGSNTTTTNQNQSYTPNPVVAQGATQAIQGAEKASAQPFQMPVAPIAGFNPFQTQAFGQIQGMQGMTAPYYNTAGNLMTGSAMPISDMDVEQYYNPMVANVTRQMQNIFGQQMAQATRNATQMAGGVGADRIGVAQGNIANQQSLAAGQTYAGLWQNALQAAQQQKQMMANAGYGMGALGTGAQAAALQGTGALAGAGAQQQQLQQAQMNAPYQNLLARIAYQFQTPQYLAGIVGGLAPAMGGTTSGQGTYTPPPPNPLNSIIGGTLGLGGLGLGAYQAGMFGGSGSDTSGQGEIFNFAKDGGRIAMQDGGSPDDLTLNPPDIPGVSIPKTGGLSPIPNIRLPMGGGQFHNNLNLNPPQQQQQSSGGLGDIAKIAGAVLPFILNRGGHVDSIGGAVLPEHAMSGYQEGGDVEDVPLPTPNPLGGLTPSMRELFPELRTAAAERGVNFDIGEGYRPQERQDRLYAQGRTMPGPIVTQTPHSLHTQGNAIDVVPTGGTNEEDVGRTVTDLTRTDPRFTRMRSGATFSNLHDPLHVEIPGNQEARTPGAPGIIPTAAIPPGATLAQSRYMPQTFNQDMSMRQYGAGPTPYPHAAEDNFGSRFARSPWMNLALAGARMAASRSPFVGQAVGEGMEAGLKGFETQRKANLSEQEANQRAAQLAQQAQIHLDQYQRLTAAQQLEANKPFKIGEDPNTGLDIYGIRDGRGNLIPIDPQTGMPKAEINPTQVQGPETKKDQGPAPLGVEEFRPNLSPSKAQGLQMIKGPFAVAEAGNIRNIDAQMNKGRDALDVQHDQINRLKMDYATVMKDNDKDGFFTRMLQTPGANPESRVEAMKLANLTATSAGKAPVFNPEKVAAMEEAIKIQKTMGMSFAATISPRDAMQMQLASISAQPGFTQSPQGMMRLIGLYDGLTNHGEARHDFWGRWKATNPRTATGWEEDFRTKNPVDKFTARALVENMPNQRAKEKLPEAVEYLRSHKDDRDAVTKFNKIYNNTASFFITGKLDPYSLLAQ